MSNGPRWYKSRTPVSQAWKWSTVGEEFSVERLREIGKDIAQWCDGDFWQDDNPEDRDKTYYWMVHVPNCGIIRPGNYLVKRDDGSFEVMSGDDFEKQFDTSWEGM